ncbi:MAG: hypothetical protein ACFCGT_04250 [Sandaracinaceae bacterium]
MTTDLTEFAALAAALTGIDASEHPATLAEHGSSPEAWEAAVAHFTPRLEEDSDLREDYADAFREALVAQVGPVDLDLDRYIESSVAAQCGTPFEEVVASLGLDARRYLAAGYAWTARLSDEPRRLALYEARVKLGVAHHRREERPLPPPRAATHARPIRCDSCGAPKVTTPRTAYVYCDYCGALFDYDFDLAGEILHGLPFGEISAILRRGVIDEIRAAREAGDEETWRACWAWVFEHDMRLTPETWSPRILEPTYRDAMVRWSAETSLVVAKDERFARSQKRVEEAYIHAIGAPSADHLVAYARACIEDSETRVGAWSEWGLLEQHPDGDGPEVILRNDRKWMLRECLANADDDARARILELAGIDDRYDELPPVDLSRATCGPCGGPLLLAEGARRLLCEACGHVLDADAPRFACPSCGASVIAARRGRVSCRWCQARFDVL